MAGGNLFFVLTVLATLGFYYRVELAQAVFLIVAPMSLVGGLSLRAARRMQNGGTGAATSTGG